VAMGPMAVTADTGQKVMRKTMARRQMERQHRNRGALAAIRTGRTRDEKEVTIAHCHEGHVQSPGHDLKLSSFKRQQEAQPGTC
jgi:hypothetical protein